MKCNDFVTEFTAKTNALRNHAYKYCGRIAVANTRNRMRRSRMLFVFCREFSSVQGKCVIVHPAHPAARLSSAFFFS